VRQQECKADHVSPFKSDVNAWSSTSTRTYSSTSCYIIKHRDTFFTFNELRVAVIKPGSCTYSGSIEDMKWVIKKFGGSADFGRRSEAD
jgi:hypothetical protein